MLRMHVLTACWLLPALAGTMLGQTSAPASTPTTASAPTTGASTPADLARIAGRKGAAVNAPDTFRFAVLSDNTGQHAPGILAQAIEQVNLLRPDFVMCTGDFVEGFEKDRAGAEKEWDEAEALLRKLDAPFFYCLGNHDAPNPTYRKAYARLAERSPTAGRPWYSFEYRGCHFVVFDSTATEREIPGLAEEQWAWLAKDLAAAADARHIFLFEHHPIFGDRGDWMRLRKLLHDGKTTIFSGHDHSLSYAVEHGIPYQALGPTGGFGGEGDWRRGACHQFAWVTVSGGQPRVAIVPVGHILPHDLRPGRQAAARHRAAWWGAECSPITREGGETTFTLPNASDVEATYTLTWTGPAAWFGNAPPEPETVTVAPGKSIQRKCRLAAVSEPSAEPPAMELAYRFAADGQEAKGTGRAGVFARAVLEARRADKIAVDGKLDDWAAAPGWKLGARWQVTDSPEAWKGPADCSATLRIGYDDRNLYVALDVTDDVLFTEGKESWRRDGVEVFWDPRGPDERGGMFTQPCRQVVVVLPAEGQAAAAEITPVKHDPSPQVQSACRRREGGYVVELAVPIASIAEGFKVAPGAALRMDFALNDRDEPDPPPAADGDEVKPKAKPVLAPTTYISLSGYGKPGYRTHAYATVTFK